MKLDEMTKFAKKNNIDLATQIKRYTLIIIKSCIHFCLLISDNHLHISFHSLSKGLDIKKQGLSFVTESNSCRIYIYPLLGDKEDKSEGPEEDSNIRQGTLMQVEVLLYRFKHPTAEVRIINQKLIRNETLLLMRL